MFRFQFCVMEVLKFFAIGLRVEDCSMLFSIGVTHFFILVGDRIGIEARLYETRCPLCLELVRMGKCKFSFSPSYSGKGPVVQFMRFRLNI
jgi:hypothetical protein